MSSLSLALPKLEAKAQLSRRSGLIGDISFSIKIKYTVTFKVVT